VADEPFSPPSITAALRTPLWLASELVCPGPCLAKEVLIGKFCLRLVSRQFERSAEMQARQRKCDTSSVLQIAGLESSRAAAALHLDAVAFPTRLSQTAAPTS
jgi:hypothetical protein